MATKKKMLQAAAGNAGGAGLDITEVFSTYLYAGNNSTQTITNGIDLAGEGGLVWIKGRDFATGNLLFDTERGALQRLISNGTNASENANFTLTSFNSDGFSIGDSSTLNGGSRAYASWTFRKAPKFFDVVTWTGDGTSARQISHNLGSTPGMILVKITSEAGGWAVYHRGNTANPETQKLRLDNTDATSTHNDYWADTAPTSTHFTIGSDGDVNQNAATYVAYLFAHNDGDGGFGPDGDQDIIKCGSYTGNGTKLDINLGFEAQWVLVKRTDTSGYDWHLFDVMRGMPVGSDAKWLEPNTSAAEGSNAYMSANSNGFTLPDGHPEVCANGGTYIYMAIRRGPLAQPESATEVFDVYAGNDAYPTVITTGFTVDSLLGALRSGNSNNFISGSRLTGSKSLITSSTAAQGNGLFSGSTNACFMRNDGILPSTFGSSNTVYYSWKRAPGFCDVVAYTGDGVAGRTVSHNLGVAPEMIWVKARSAGDNWYVYHKDLTSAAYALILNSTTAQLNAPTLWNSTTPTDSVFTVGSDGGINGSTKPFISYLFSSLDGISKVGSYTGDGTTDGSKVIDCGFSNSARFVLIKTSSHSDPWLVFDSVRGIVSSGNDPYLRLNDTSAEQAGLDVLDPQSSGFGVRGNLTNVNNYTYIFYAIA